MNSMTSRLSIVAITILVLTACNYTPGECWPAGQGDGSAGVGSGGIIVPGGTGDFGDTPPKPGGAIPEADCNSKPAAPAAPAPPAGSPGNQCASGQGSEGGTANDGGAYTFCSGPCTWKCSVGGIHHFSASEFKFVTTVVDDGKDVGGGWQEAVVKLKIRRWVSWFPESWECPLKIGTPLRSLLNGKISPDVAANISAEVATNASDAIMSTLPSIPQGIFCSQLKDQMDVMLKKIVPGAKVGLP